MAFVVSQCIQLFVDTMAAVSLQSHRAPLEEEDRKIPSKLSTNQLYYYAVRHCDALKSPAIFTCFEDCQLYVDPDENDGNVVDYRSFETIPEAVRYILESPILLQALRKMSARKPLSTT